MSCETIDDLDCENLCSAVPATGLKVTIIKNRISDTEDSIEIDPIPVGETFPCAGFGLFTGCNGGKREIIFFGSSTILPNGNILISEIKRGLAFTGTNTSANTASAYQHGRSEEFIIGDTQIHYYFIKLCECLSALKDEVRGVVATVSQLPTTAYVGERVVVWNGGSPLLYVYNSLGGGTFGWRPVAATVQLATETGFGVVKLACEPTDPLNPTVYNVGCPGLDLIVANAETCDGDKLNFGNIGIVANYGSSLNNLYSEQAPALVVTDFSGDSFETQVDSYAFTVPTLSDLMINLLVNKATVGADPEVPSTEGLYAVVYNVDDSVVEYTTLVSQTYVDEITNVTPIHKWKNIPIVGKALDLQPEVNYEIRIFASFDQLGTISYVEANYSQVIYNLIALPKCP